MAQPMNKWNEEDESGEEPVGVATRIASKKKWDDEEGDDEVLDSWDAADDSEEERKKQHSKQAAAEKAAAEAAANHKTKTQRIAEKQAEKQAALERAECQREEIENETPAERKEREMLRQIESDLAHAENLFSNVGIDAGSGIGNREKKITMVDPDDPSKDIDLSTLSIFNPTTKDGFLNLRETLVPLLIANTKKANYPAFLQEFTKQLSKDMPSEQIKKVATGLTVLANEKQKEEKAAEKGSKKKTVKKAAALVASGKEMDKPDITNYSGTEYYDDDFM